MMNNDEKESLDDSNLTKKRRSSDEEQLVQILVAFSCNLSVGKTSYSELLRRRASTYRRIPESYQRFEQVMQFFS